MKSFKELTVWQKSVDLTEEIYNLCAMLPKAEIFGLGSQMQRAAVSVPSNIAEATGVIIVKNMCSSVVLH